MSNVKTGPETISDTAAGLTGKAKNAKERKAALISCLTDSNWSTTNIGRLERVDNDRFHGWKMWGWKKWEG